MELIKSMLFFGDNALRRSGGEAVKNESCGGRCPKLATREFAMRNVNYDYMYSLLDETKVERVALEKSVVVVYRTDVTAVDE